MTTYYQHFKYQKISQYKIMMPFIRNNISKNIIILLITLPMVGIHLGQVSWAEKGEDNTSNLQIDNKSTPIDPNIKLSLPVKGWLLMDYNTGEVLEELNGSIPLEPASITKLMTSYIISEALENHKITDEDLIEISAYARKQEGSRMFVEKGSKIAVKDLMKGMVIQSGNDSTVALAEHLAESEAEFVKIMNDTAQKIGLKNTHYENTTGLPAPKHLSTAYDIALLSRHIIKDYPSHYSLYAQKEFTWNKIKQANRNRLLWLDPSVDGLKTGHTETAGYCLVASALRGNFRLIAVVLGAKTESERYKSTLALLNYGYQKFESKRIYEAKQKINEIPLIRGTKKSIAVGFSEPLDLAFQKNQYDKISAKINFNNQLSAPIKAGEVIAELILELNGKIVAKQKLQALEDVAESGFISRIIDEALFRIRNKLSHLKTQIF